MLDFYCKHTGHADSPCENVQELLTAMQDIQNLANTTDKNVMWRLLAIESITQKFVGEHESMKEASEG